MEIETYNMTRKAIARKQTFRAKLSYRLSTGKLHASEAYGEMTSRGWSIPRDSQIGLRAFAPHDLYLISGYNHGPCRTWLGLGLG